MMVRDSWRGTTAKSRVHRRAV